MQVKEFIDAYSDDLIYLREGRQALLTHPLRREMKELCDSSYCRMLAIVMIAGIEYMFLEWQKRDKTGVLETWFSDKDPTGKKVTNGDRVSVLYDAFRKAGIAVDKEVFDDFLAIKYLRNTIVHGKWKNYEREWLEKRAFPTDTRNLTESHWNKLLAVNDNMMLYITLTSIVVKQPGTQSPQKTIRLPEAASFESEGIVRERDLPGIFWLNLEGISERVYKAIEQAVLIKEYYWAKDLSEEAIKSLPGIERKMLFYKAARKAGEGSLDVLAAQKELAAEALYSWQQYCHLTFGKLQLSREAIIEATQVIDALHSKGKYFKGASLPWSTGMPLETASKLIRHLLEGYEPLSAEQIVTAFNRGSSVYEIMPNSTPTYVLNVLLPIVDPPNTRVYLEAGYDALAAMELQASWHSFVERRQPPLAENLLLCKQLRGVFAEEL